MESVNFGHHLFISFVKFTVFKDIHNNRKVGMIEKKN
jgi:hypothetical protein